MRWRMTSAGKDGTEGEAEEEEKGGTATRWRGWDRAADGAHTGRSRQRGVGRVGVGGGTEDRTGRVRDQRPHGLMYRRHHLHRR